MRFGGRPPESAATAGRGRWARRRGATPRLQSVLWAESRWRAGRGDGEAGAPTRLLQVMDHGGVRSAKSIVPETRVASHCLWRGAVRIGQAHASGAEGLLRTVVRSVLSVHTETFRVPWPRPVRAASPPDALLCRRVRNPAAGRGLCRQPAQRHQKRTRGLNRVYDAALLKPSRHFGWEGTSEATASRFPERARPPGRVAIL